jgi:hypothetical protein
MIKPHIEAIAIAVALALVVMAVGCGLVSERDMAPLGFFLIGASILGGALVVGIIASLGADRPEAPERGFDRTRFSSPKIVIRTKLRCPYCHDGLNGKTRECAGCRATYHEDCLEEAHGCVTLGCRNRASRPRVRL